MWGSSNRAVATVSAGGVLDAVASSTINAANATGTATQTLEVMGIGPGLNGAVGDTNFHYVATKTFGDYRRKYFDDIVQMGDLSWHGTGWRGDSVNAQFVLWTGAEPQSKVSVAAADLAGPGGAKIPASNIKLDFLRSVMAGQGNPSAGRPQESVPDILNGTAPVALEPRSVQGVWMNVEVPAAASPGIYTGTVTATSVEGNTVTFALNLEVLDMVLPPASQWEHFVDLWQNPYAIARAANIPNDQLFTKPHFAAMLPYYKKLAAGGQDVITATVVSDPWGGQTHDKYASLVKWNKRSNGEWEFDYTDFDAWVDFMMNDVGITGQIDAYSMVNWAGRILYFDQATGTDIDDQVNVGAPEWNAMWGAFLDDFGPHLKAKGWFEKTYMAMDERALDDIMLAVDLIAVHSPGLKTAAAMDYNSIEDPRLDKIDKISVGSYYVDLGDAEFTAAAKHRGEVGLITSMYNCVGHYPNSFTRSNPAESYWVQWKTLATGAGGYLRWAFDSFVQAPFTTTDFRTWESGDSALIYPGALSSVRWEKATEGIRDAEKVRILSKLSPTAAADLAALMEGMTNPGMAKDPFGGVIDPGLVDIPKEADRLRTGLDAITRSYVKSHPIMLRE
ncbi:MAG: glycoside hydrolase domain-containing protein [Specibacter sp.]